MATIIQYRPAFFSGFGTDTADFTTLARRGCQPSRTTFSRRP